MRRVIRRTLILAAAITVCLSGTAWAQQVSPIHATLVIPDAKVLPGVPFDMWIDVSNPSDSAVTLGLFPRLIVHTDRGSDFVVSPQPGDYPVLLRGARTEGSPIIRYLTLAPGEKQTLTLPIEDWMSNTQFFRDSRLSQPGRYTLAIRLERFPNVFDPAPLTFQGPVITTEASVERIDPTGADAKVWQRMLQLGNGRWGVFPMVGTAEAPAEESAKMWGAWEEIIAKYPDSNYLPYALIAHAGAGPKYLQAVIDAIDRFPSSPVIEYLQAKVRDMTSASCALPGSPMAAVCRRASAIVENSRRPTTRIRVFGREDLPKAPCPPDYDCQP